MKALAACDAKELYLSMSDSGNFIYGKSIIFFIFTSLLSSCSTLDNRKNSQEDSILQNQLEYKLIGSGKHTIVFLNGFRMDFASWDMIYPQISDNNQVVLFNRRDVGASAKATKKKQEKWWLLNLISF